MNIIIVEDDRDNSDTLSQWLRDQGHTVDVYSTAEDSFRRFDCGPVADAVVVDLRLPYSDGDSVLTVMRALPMWAAVPAVLVSGAVCELPRDGALPGPTVSLPKPFDPQELVDAFNRAKEAAWLTRAL